MTGYEAITGRSRDRFDDRVDDALLFCDIGLLFPS